MLAQRWRPLFAYVRSYSNTLHKNIYKMNIAYFRHPPGDPQLQISLRFKNSEHGIDRDFNFSRNINETVSTWTERIRNNIQKEFDKKFKKKKGKKKEPTEEQPATEMPEITVQMLKDETALDDITFADLFKSTSENTENLSLCILNENYTISYNAPWIVNLTLPTSILAGFFVYPSTLELLFANKESSNFIWYRGKMPESKNENTINWEEVFDGAIYTTTTEDIGHHLKLQCIPSNGKITGAMAEYTSKCEVQAGPGSCPFENRHMFTREKLVGDKFRVTTYNLLADYYADSDYTRTELFPYCPAYALIIDYRKQLFIKEILGYNSDIICLQEVDSKIFDLDLLPVFDIHGYAGTFQKKGTCPEGLATFYNHSRFELITKYGINIGENIPKNCIFQSLWEKIQNNAKLVERIVDRSTALQVTVLRSKDTNNYLLVANTHLYFHPDADHVRLLQIGFSILYVEYLYNLTIKESKISEDNISIIFCGDFNSVPECGIYKLLIEKFVDESCVDWSSNEEEAVKGVSLKQSFNFESACGCPKYTNFTTNFAACLDYIFYQKENLKVEEVIPLPSDDELEAHIAIPSVVFPSDHIALVADLKWTSK